MTINKNNTNTNEYSLNCRYLMHMVFHVLCKMFLWNLKQHRTTTFILPVLKMYFVLKKKKKHYLVGTPKTVI